MTRRADAVIAQGVRDLVADQTGDPELVLDKLRALLAHADHRREPGTVTAQLEAYWGGAGCEEDDHG